MRKKPGDFPPKDFLLGCFIVEQVLQQRIISLCLYNDI